MLNGAMADRKFTRFPGSRTNAPCRGTPQQSNSLLLPCTRTDSTTWVLFEEVTVSASDAAEQRDEVSHEVHDLRPGERKAVGRVESDDRVRRAMRNPLNII